jgi:hypothetical protein
MTRGLKRKVLYAAVVASQAQVCEQIRHATVGGSSRKSGKCTIEVPVDIAAEVDINGDYGPRNIDITAARVYNVEVNRR